MKKMPEERLEAGDVGTVVHVCRDARAYEIEFTTLDSSTAAVVPVGVSDVRPIARHEITHSRTLAS